MSAPDRRQSRTQIFLQFFGFNCQRPSSPVRQVRRAPDHFFGRIYYPPYHFFAISAASVVLTCDLNPSNHQKCRVLLIRLSLTHVVARVSNRHSQGVKTIRPSHTPCKTMQSLWQWLNSNLQYRRRRSLFTNPKGFEAHEDTNNNMYIHGDGRNSIDMH